MRSGLPAAHIEYWRRAVEPGALGFVTKIGDTDLGSCSGSALAELLNSALKQLRLVLRANYQTDFAHLIPLARFTNAMRQAHHWTDAEILTLVRTQAPPQMLYSTSVETLARRLAQNPAVEQRLRQGVGRGFGWIVGDDKTAREAWRVHRLRWGLTLYGYDLDEPTIAELPELERRAVIQVLDKKPGSRELPCSNLADQLTDCERDLLHDASKWFNVREEGESVKAAVLGAVRLMALEIGCRLRARGALLRPEMALYMKAQELLEVCESPAVFPPLRSILDREKSRADALSRNPVREFGRPAVRNPDLGWLPGASRSVHQAVALLAQNEILPDVADEGRELRGRGASLGIHTGKVRVVRAPVDSVEGDAGDVIVAQSVSSTWAAGFWADGALVTEAGGLLSHSAIMAREMGIPAVVGVQAATTRLGDGEVVTVDGYQGIVTRRM